VTQPLAQPDGKPMDALLEVVALAWSRELRRRFGPSDNFFFAGGTSLAATRVVAELSRDLGVDVSVPVLLRHPTLQEFVDAIRSQAGADAREPLPQVGEDATPPITVQQEAVWFLEQLVPRNTAYNSLVVLDVDGPLDLGRLRAALAAVAERHALLRTSFPTHRGRPVLRRHRDVAPDAEVLDSAPSTPRELDAWAAGIASEPFSLVDPPLFRCVVAGPREAPAVVLAEHHFLHDGWSLGTLIRELAHAYRTGRVDGELEVPNQYADYAAWQTLWLETPQAAEATRYWADLLSDPVEPVRFPRDGDRPPAFSFRGSTVHARLPDDVLAAARESATELGTTPFVVLMAAFAAVIGEVAGLDDLNLGSMLRNRRVPGTENVLGMFVNTVALPVRGWRGSSLRDLAGELGAMLWKGMEHQELPFPLVARALPHARDMSRNPLFQICFSMNDYPRLVADFGEGVSGVPRYPSTGGAKFDLDVVLIPDERGCAALWRYYDGVLDRVEVSQLVDAFHEAVLGAARAADLPLELLVRGDRRAALTARTSRRSPP
jgi:Condensation domain/Phosphopantetheine attachment site